jgi:hypothetical protein
MATVIRGSDNFDSADAGKVLQVGNFQTGAVATGTTVLPYDDTIPQITEGNEYMTLNFTPTNASSTLIIEVICQANSNLANGNAYSTALFEGTTANALAAIGAINFQGYVKPAVLTHKMTAGTTNQLTFRVRAGAGTTGTTTFNGHEEGNRRFGGVMASSITVTEVAA